MTSVWKKILVLWMGSLFLFQAERKAFGKSLDVSIHLNNTPIRSYISYYKGPLQSPTFEEVTAEASEKYFHPISEKTFPIENCSHKLWSKLVVNNPSKQNQEIFLTIPTGSINLWEVYQPAFQPARIMRTGYDVSSSKWPIPYLYPSVKVDQKNPQIIKVETVHEKGKAGK